MFEDSLIESGGKLKTKRGWTSIISFALQVMIVGVMILIPLIFTEALPKGTTMFMLVAPPPPPPPPPPAAAPVKVVKQIQTDIVNGELRTPTKIPKKVEMIKEDEAPPPVMASTGAVGGVPGGVPGGSMGGVIGSVLNSTPVAVPKIATPQRVRASSGAQSGLLVRKVNPTYPPLAIPGQRLAPEHASKCPSTVKSSEEGKATHVRNSCSTCRSQSRTGRCHLGRPGRRRRDGDRSIGLVESNGLGC